MEHADPKGASERLSDMICINSFFHMNSCLRKRGFCSKTRDKQKKLLK